MDYNGPKTEKHLIDFVSSVNAKGPSLLEDLSSINEFIHNSTDKFFVSFAFKVYLYLYNQNSQLCMYCYRVRLGTVYNTYTCVDIRRRKHTVGTSSWRGHCDKRSAWQGLASCYHATLKQKKKPKLDLYLLRR